MLHFSLFALHHSCLMASLVADDIWYDQLERFPDIELEGVPISFGKEISCHIRHNWSSSDIPVSDIQISLF